jgi:hypothetical protein
MLVELWNLVVIEGFVEYSFSGPFTTPVSLIPTGTNFAGRTIVRFVLTEPRKMTGQGIRPESHPS